jgi:hypothetical protein
LLTIHQTSANAIPPRFDVIDARGLAIAAQQQKTVTSKRRCGFPIGAVKDRR